MAKPGFALNSFGTEFVNCLESLKAKRDELQAIIDLEELEKAKLQGEIECLANRLSVIMTSLTKKTAARSDYDRAITELEITLCRLIENSQLAVNNIRRELSVLSTDDIMKTTATCPVNQDYCLIDPPPLRAMPEGDQGQPNQPPAPPVPPVGGGVTYRQANGL